VAFFGRALAPHRAKLPAYERELIGLVKAVRNWRPYLWGRSFTVRTDHRSLKYILDQRLITIPQHQWVIKLFGYDLDVIYNPGNQNGAADALSRRDEETMTLHALSTARFDVFDVLCQELATDSYAKKLQGQLEAGTDAQGWSSVDGLLLFHGKVLLPESSTLWP
jgi:hypothetical protein